MNFKYKIFAKIYNFFSLINSKKENNVSFIIEGTSFNGNLKHIQEELDKRDNFNYSYIYKDKYSFGDSETFFSKILSLVGLINFFFIKTYKLAKSKYIFLNDNFFPLAFMNFDSSTMIIQLWHASGAFKKFGLDSVTDENIKNLLILVGSKIDYLIISSNNISKIYQNAFCVDKNKILSLGTPRMDYYFNEKNYNSENISKIRFKFEKKYPEIKNKKIILYAPTFRENKELNNDISNHFDMKLFNSIFKNDYKLFFKSHPKFNVPNIEGSIDVSNYSNIQEILMISDILITDYSSIMIEYSVLSKPIIFYPFDLEYYTSNERGFYFDYTNVPGPIARNTQDIVNIIKENNFDFEKLRCFAHKNFDYLDNKSSKRIVDFLMKR